jgi:hypothetical protein
MAIVIQEEKNKGSWFGFGMLFVILIILGIALYYLFFVQPQILTSAGESQSLEEFSRMQFDPRTVIESDIFTQQKQFIPLTAPAGGNPRPFGVE